MSDARLRELQQRFNETRSEEDERNLILYRMKIGDLDQRKLMLARLCGHQPLGGTIEPLCQLSRGDAAEFLISFVSSIHGLMPDHDRIRVIISLADVIRELIDDPECNTRLESVIGWASQYAGDDIRNRQLSLFPSGCLSLVIPIGTGAESIDRLLSGLGRAFHPSRYKTYKKRIESYKLIVWNAFNLIEGDSINSYTNDIDLAFIELIRKRICEDVIDWALGYSDPLLKTLY